MSWNYRVIEFVEPDGNPYRQIHEVHYKKDEFSEIPESYQEDPAIILWDTLEGDSTAYEILNAMQSSLSKPVLVETDFNKNKLP
jgi:hypothetical protein